MGTITIGDSCEVLNGYAFKSEKYTSSGIRIIRIANVQKGYIEDDSPVFYQTSDVDLNKYMLRENDLLVSLTGNVGRTALLTKDMLPAALNQRVACLRLKTNKITRGFLFHLLNSDYFESKCIQSSQGVAQKNLSTEWLKSYDLPLYSLSKQNEITKILDNVRNTIVLKKQEIQKYDELIKARFIEMFGDLKSNEKDWDLKTFEEMSVLITDGEHSTPKRTKEGIYLLSARNVLNHSLQLEDVDYINRDEYLRIAKRVVPKKGDILISCSGTIGRCCSIPDSLQLQMVRSVALIRFKEVINPIFAEYMITSDYLQEQINSSKTMSSQANLFQGKIRKLKGFLPPTELQQQFADFVQQVDKSREEVKKSLEKTQQLYDSLMQEYFG